MIQPTDTVLFQGDSITDAGRDRGSDAPNDPAALGRGYAHYAAAMLLARRDGDAVRVFNRGVSGNRVTNLRDRWQADCLDLQPDVLSVLIGVNDSWHGVAKGTPENGVPLDEYEAVYRQILDRAKDANPDLRLVLCEPFTAKCGAVMVLDFFPDIDERRGIVKRLAADYGAVFVPFQQVFDDAAQSRPHESLASDGVHPTVAGHMLMAQAWVAATA